jgi:iron complex transport system permease protein
MSKTFGEHPRPSIATAVWTPTRLALVMSALAVLLVLAGLAAGSEGLSFAWQDNGWVIGAIRAPRTLGALCAGGLLGLSGAIAQGVFRNPLADPYLLGSASGATLAIVLTLAAGSAVGVPVALLGGDWLAGRQVWISFTTRQLFLPDH